LRGIKFRNSGSDGQLLVWWPSFSHSAQGGGMHGGSGAVGSFFFLLPPTVAGGLVSGGGGGGGKDGNRHGDSFLGGKGWSRDHLWWV
jgi:hypothetical protein